MFYENLDLPCVFSKGFEADRCNAAAMWADRMFRTGMEPSCMIYHCALLQIVHRPGEAGFTDSLIAHLNKGRPFFWRATHHRGLRMSDFMCNFPESI